MYYFSHADDLRNIAITGPQLENITLVKTDPDLILRLAAKRGEHVRVDLNESRVLAIAQTGSNISVSCLPWLQMSPPGSSIRWRYIPYVYNLYDFTPCKLTI